MHFRSSSGMTRRAAMCLAALIALGATGCGTNHLFMQIDRHPVWQDTTETQLVHQFNFHARESSRQGRMTVTFRGPDGTFEVPARYSITQAPENSPRGWIEVKYDATDEHKEKYRKAVAHLKARPEASEDVRKLPDELPQVDRFHAEAANTPPPSMTLASESGYKFRLAPPAQAPPPKGGP